LAYRYVNLSNEVLVLLTASLQFFMPSVRTYSFQDRIPFHIQMSGQLRSLLEFFPKHLTDGQIKVTIERRLTINVSSRQFWSSRIIGRGTVNCEPPKANDCPFDTREQAHLDWAGEIQLDPLEGTTPTFSTSVVQLKVIGIFRRLQTLADMRELLGLHHTASSLQKPHFSVINDDGPYTPGNGYLVVFIRVS
jgi:hypothetical protein